MEISKLSISQETISRINSYGHISPKRKRQIRIDGVKNLIRSKPSGHLFKPLELIQAAGYRTYSTNGNIYNAGFAFLKTLLKSGIIAKSGEFKKHKSPYYIPEDLKIKESIKSDDIVGRKIVDTVFTEKIETIKEEVETIENDIDEKDQHVENDCASYCIEVKIMKRSVAGEYGKQQVADMSMSDTTLNKAQYMINQLIENVR